MMFRLSVRLASVAATLAVMAACGKGDSPTAPSGPPAPNPCTQSQGCPPINSIGFWFRINASEDNGAAGAPWTFTFLNKTYTASGSTEYGLVNMTPGDYEVSGTFPTVSFSMTLGRQAGGKGGVVIGSVKSLEGPVSATQFSPGCGVAYFVPFGAPKPNTFKIQFSIAANIEGC